MLLEPLRWLARNLSSLLLAFILSLVVWVSAVVAADPNEERVYTRPIVLVGQDTNLLLVGEIPAQARITLEAPRSILTDLTNNPARIEAWVDLSGLGPGEHTAQVRVNPTTRPTRTIDVEPDEISFTLEPIVTAVLPVQLNVIGEPSLGYRKGTPEINPDSVTISGPESIVSKVSEIRTSLQISGATQTVRNNIVLEAVDENGQVVQGVTLNPKNASVSQPVTLVSGFKNVAVKVITTGQVAEGYRITNISVTPPNVTVSSANPQLVNEIPGFVETLPVDLNGLTDDIEIRVTLNLSEGITLVGEQSVLVQIGVAALEGNLTVSLPVEATGLPPELAAIVSPAAIDVIVAGPLPILDTLTPASFRAVVDLTNFAPGTYQLAPLVDLVPGQVQIQAILPESVEVIVGPAPTITPTLSPPTATAAP